MRRRVTGSRVESSLEMPSRRQARTAALDRIAETIRWTHLRDTEFAELWALVQEVSQADKLIQIKRPQETEYRVYRLVDAGHSSTAWNDVSVTLSVVVYRGLPVDAAAQTDPIITLPPPPP